MQTTPLNTSFIPKLYDICLQEYGLEIIFKDTEVLQKTLEMCFEKYGYKDIFLTQEIQSYLQNNSIIKYVIEDKLLKSTSIRSQILASCEHLFPITSKKQSLRPPKELPQYDEESLKVLKQEYISTRKEILDWLNSELSFNFKADFQLSKNTTINLYDENKKVGIDFCGLYENELTTREQYNKYRTCLVQSIQLLTIYSDEWATKKKQCQGHIKSVLGITKERIFARKCEIRELPKHIACNFFDEFHIQGRNNLAIICYGLYYKDELVAAMTLGRHHRQNTDGNDAILDRLCFKDGVQVIGGASKLLKICCDWAKKEEFGRVISFSDNRWSIGKVYEAMNFLCDRDYRPDYCYVNIKNPLKRISKQSQRKGSTNCPEGMTELQWATERNLVRIWDCGKKRWILNL